MINSISIKNFESHKDTTIKLHTGVNVVIGESDEGKSSIIRAIKWNSHNRPQGDSYRSDLLDTKNKKDRIKLTEVDIKYGKLNVLRARDGTPGGINHYQIGNDETLRALRSDVPDEVQEIACVKDVNIQGQHPSEQYFLLADKPGQVAKEFNKVAGLVIMDKATADINSQIRSCNSMIKMNKAEIEDKTAEIKDSEWVISAEKLSNKLSDFKIKLSNTKLYCHELNLKIYDLKEIDNEITSYDYIKDALKEIAVLSELLAESVNKQSEVKPLSDVIKELDKVEIDLVTYDCVDEAKKNLNVLKKQKQDIDDIKNEIKQISDLINALNNVDTQLIVTVGIDDALIALKCLNSDKKQIKIQQDYIESIKQILQKLELNKDDLKLAEVDVRDAHTKRDLIRTHTACPTCGRKG